MHFSHADPTKVNVSSLCISLRFFEQCKFPQYLSEHHLSINQQSGLCNFCISSPMLKLWNANTHDFRIGNYRRSRQLPIQLIQASKESIYLWSSKIIVPIIGATYLSPLDPMSAMTHVPLHQEGPWIWCPSVERHAQSERLQLTTIFQSNHQLNRWTFSPQSSACNKSSSDFIMQTNWENGLIQQILSLSRSRYLEPMLGCVHRRRVFINILL